jgi:selenoprotein W-related protein
LAEELERELGAKVKLKASHGGVFEVSVDGDLVFSKKSLGRFPDAGETLRIIRSRG